MRNLYAILTYVSSAAWVIPAAKIININAVGFFEHHAVCSIPSYSMRRTSEAGSGAVCCGFAMKWTFDKRAWQRSIFPGRSVVVATRRVRPPGAAWNDSAPWISRFTGGATRRQSQGTSSKTIAATSCCGTKGLATHVVFALLRLLPSNKDSYSLCCGVVVHTCMYVQDYVCTKVRLWCEDLTTVFILPRGSRLQILRRAFSDKR
jgi:hypothetical protein